MNCTLCKNSVPVITKALSHEGDALIAEHCCSACNTFLFEMEIRSGAQLIATRDIHSHDKSYIVPKGRLLRVTAFSELPSHEVGLLFSGLFGVGAFTAKGFAAKWDIKKIISDEVYLAS